MVESGPLFSLIPSRLKLIVHPGREPAVNDNQPSAVFILHNLLIAGDGLSVGIDHPVGIFTVPDHAVPIFLIRLQPESVYIIGIFYPLETVSVPIGDTITFKTKGMHSIIQFHLQFTAGLHGTVIQFVRRKEVEVRLLYTIYIPFYEMETHS